MKTLSETLGVSRSRQYEKRQQGPNPRKRHYRRAGDERYLALIRQIIEERATCGYRHVTVFLNRILMSQGEPTVNPKRVYRLMKIGGLLLQRDHHYVPQQCPLVLRCLRDCLLEQGATPGGLQPGLL